MKISDIGLGDLGKRISITAKVMSVRQTSGPTVFEIADGSGKIKATAFTSPGKRAFPGLEAGEQISMEAVVKARNSLIELEMTSYKSFGKPKEEDLSEKGFLIESKNLEKMREDIIMAAEIIKKAVQESRPIIIRHHDDADGYVSGIILERALYPMISADKHYYFLSRTACRTPYYDYVDALRDLNNYFISQKYVSKPPLVVLCDLGSSSQSQKAMNRMKDYGMDFVIIDHHRFDEENIKLSLAFVNPHRYDLGSELTAGILATEVARFINQGLDDIKHLPALSATADKSAEEDYEKYVEASGFSPDYLKAWALLIDHETFYLRFNETKDILEDIFFPTDVNKRLIKRIVPMLEEEMLSVQKAAEKYASIKDMPGFILIRIDKYKVGSPGDYASSKLTRITHELKDGPRITLSEGEGSISYRADLVAWFDGVKMISWLKEKMPYALITGGGHPFAGGISFSPAAKEELIKNILSWLEDKGKI